MITFVTGKLVSKKPTQAVIDVHGIGYQIHIPTTTYERLPDPGASTTLHTHHHVREDAVLLFGFADPSQRAVFQLMISVTGIGPKLALAALSAFDADDLCGYIARGDVGVLTGIPGVGRKTAERMIVELKDKVADTALAVAAGGAIVGNGSLRADALAALEALGLSRVAAEKNVAKVLKEDPEIATVEELIRRALKSG